MTREAAVTVLSEYRSVLASTDVVYMTGVAEDRNKLRNLVFDHFGLNITAEHKCSRKVIQETHQEMR